jgi:hypothetical protein
MIIGFLQRFFLNFILIFLMLFVSMSIAGGLTNCTIDVEYGVLVPLGVIAVAVSFLQADKT